MKELLLSVDAKEVRLAKLRNRRLDELLIERKKNQLLSGNIYLGRVTNLLKNIQSAFVDIGSGKNGFIHISDILENSQKFQEMFDMDFDWSFDVSNYNANTPKESDINKLLKQDEPVLVQVLKEPIGNKGARLTCSLSIPGRFLVLLPNSRHRGVSRKIVNKSDRDRLKQIIKAFEMPIDMGLICRTSSVFATTEQLINEAHELLDTWNKIIQGFHDNKEPTCLYKESDITKKALISAIDKKYDRLLIDHYQTYLDCMKMFKRFNVDSEHALVIEFYRDKVPMFERFSVERELDKSIQRKVWLSSGGYIYFEKTEAMHTIDVNSGRSNQKNESNVEETLVQINMEAADEIARQLRLRNIGGLVICDFIDMRYRKNQRRVLDRLKEAMKFDSAKCTILGMSEFGLVEMTRQRSRESLIQILFETCPYCDGSGIIKNIESTAIDLERAIRRSIVVDHAKQVYVELHPQILDFLKSADKQLIDQMAKKLGATVEYVANDNLHVNDFEITNQREQERVVQSS